MVAAIAMKLLSTTSSGNLSSILANDGGGDLVQVATWADDIRSQPEYHWSAPLHYIDTQDWACTYVPTQDCGDQMCVAGAIVNYTGRVVSTDNSIADEAAKFLTHFVGDIHQPLHVGFTSDRGGNTLKGSFLGQSVNLHAAWDSNIIDHRIAISFGGSMDSYTKYDVVSPSSLDLLVYASLQIDGFLFTYEGQQFLVARRPCGQGSVDKVLCFV
jgi:hypothetical protein